jgi:hypothetical protein
VYHISLYLSPVITIPMIKTYYNTIVSENSSSYTYNVNASSMASSDGTVPQTDTGTDGTSTHYSLEHKGIRVGFHTPIVEVRTPERKIGYRNMLQSASVRDLNSSPNYKKSRTC